MCSSQNDHQRPQLANIMEGGTCQRDACQTKGRIGVEGYCLDMVIKLGNTSGMKNKWKRKGVIKKQSEKQNLAETV